MSPDRSKSYLAPILFGLSASVCSITGLVFSLYFLVRGQWSIALVYVIIILIGVSEFVYVESQTRKRGTI